MCSDSQIKKVPCPNTMPVYNTYNPIQALYLKKRGVERILDKADGRTLGHSLVTEMKEKIAMQTLLIDRSMDEKSPPTDWVYQDQTSEPQDAPTIVSADECPSLVGYDSEEESDWSLPGIDGVNDIRYVYSGEIENSKVFYDDGHYYDSERRERKTIQAPQDPRKPQEEQDVATILGYLAKQFTVMEDLTILLCA